MVRQPNETLDVQKTLALKLSEPDVDPNSPSTTFNRQTIAKRLTSLVASQWSLRQSPRGWGTGKTFMLKPGRKTCGIPINAWEDDFRTHY